jgi:hypothetical protein
MTSALPETALGSCLGWSLVVTGHSLGAGIAAFVGMHLRRTYNVHAWCYSPPGWLMTPELAESTKPFVTAVVINKDMVPRHAAGRFATVVVSSRSSGSRHDPDVPRAACVAMLDQ